MASRLGNCLLRAESKTGNFGLFALYPCYCFIYCLAAPWLIFGYYWGNSLTHLMLITAFGLSMFGPKVTRKSWVSTPECPVGFNHNGITDLATHSKLQKILSTARFSFSIAVMTFADRNITEILWMSFCLIFV